MRVLILGATGLVGGYLAAAATRRDHVVTGTRFTQEAPEFEMLDLREARAVEALLERVQPDVIFHPAANPNADYCEDHPEETHAVNVAPVDLLTRLLQGSRTQYVYCSSDYVFDGEAGPYREEDIPSPISEYARQKVACEELVLERCPQGLVARITVVYGWERQGKNFISRLIRTTAKGEIVRVPQDQVGSPSSAANITETMCALVEKGMRGIYHIAGPECIDRFQFAQMAAEVFALDASLIVPVSTAELQQRARRPLRAGMVVEKVRGVLSVPLLGPRAGLEAMRAEQHPFRDPGAVPPTVRTSPMQYDHQPDYR